MPDLFRDPMATRHMNAFRDYVDRTPKVTGVIYAQADDGRLITLRVDSPNAQESLDGIEQDSQAPKTPRP